MGYLPRPTTRRNELGSFVGFMSREAVTCRSKAQSEAEPKTWLDRSFDLAERVGVSRNSIVSIESGSKLPSYPTLYSLAAAFGIEPAALLPSRRQVK